MPHEDDLAARYSLPHWLATELINQARTAAEPRAVTVVQFGHGDLCSFVNVLAVQYGLEEGERVAASFNQRGPVTLRANLVRCGGREEVMRSLRQAGIECQPTILSPWGIALTHGRPATGEWRQGWERAGR